MEKIEIFRGENKEIALELENGDPSGVLAVYLAVVSFKKSIAKSFSTLEETIRYEDGAYICDLTSSMTSGLKEDLYYLESKIVSASGVTISKLAILHILPNQVYKIQ